MALYSISCESWYTLAAKYPDHSRHCSLLLSGAVRGWKGVPTATARDPSDLRLRDLLLGVDERMRHDRRASVAVGRLHHEARPQLRVLDREPRGADVLLQAGRVDGRG